MGHFNILSIRFYCSFVLVTATCNAGIQASAQPAGNYYPIQEEPTAIGETVCISLPLAPALLP